MTRKVKIMENEKHPLDDLKNDEITVKTYRTRTFLHKRLGINAVYKNNIFIPSIEVFT